MRATRWAGLLALYVGAQALGLALAQPFRSAGFSSGLGGTSLLGPILLIVAVIVVPIIILLLSRSRGVLGTLRWVLLMAIGGALFLTLIETLVLAFPASYLLPPMAAEIALVPAIPLATAIAVTLFLALVMEPQWYVVDIAGFVAAAAVIAILGGSFALLPVFILLIALAVYDYIAVYRTKHMLRLADIVTEMKLPILMVMPEEASYDYLSAPTLAETREIPVEERGVTFMGLGDVVIPGILVVSAFVWLPATPAYLGIGANLWTAIGALLGSVVGYAVLMRLVLRGNAQAGLPLLDGGAIAGYILAFVLAYHALTFGLTGAL